MNRTGIRSIGPLLIFMTSDRLPYARVFRRPNIVQYSTSVSVKGKKDLDYPFAPCRVAAIDIHFIAKEVGVSLITASF